MYKRNSVLLLVLLAITVVVILSIVMSQGKRAENRLVAARTAYFDGYYQQAIEHFEAIGDLLLFSQEDLRFFADSYLQIGQGEKAQTVNQFLASKYPQDTDELVRQANLLRAAGKMAEAETIFKKIIEIDPIFAKGYIGFADYYLDLGTIDKAFEILQQGIGKSTQDTAKISLLLKMADIARANGNKEKAKQAYFEILTINPNHSIALKNSQQ